MLTIIQSDQFKTVPWKNGLGHTTELAINDGGTLNDFDWRLSIASVITDGEFSNFFGYQRNLVLIEGNGLTLDHQNDAVDKLTNILDIAKFDGGCRTLGKLSNGSIKDFNIITNKETVNTNVRCYREFQEIIVKLTPTSLCFAYSLTDDMVVDIFEQKNTSISVGHLVKLSARDSGLKNDQLTVSFTGKNMIIIQIENK